MCLANPTTCDCEQESCTSTSTTKVEMAHPYAPSLPTGIWSPVACTENRIKSLHGSNLFERFFFGIFTFFRGWATRCPKRCPLDVNVPLGETFQPRVLPWSWNSRYRSSTNFAGCAVPWSFILSSWSVNVTMRDTKSSLPWDSIAPPTTMAPLLLLLLLLLKEKSKKIMKHSSIWHKHTQFLHDISSNETWEAKWKLRLGEEQ